MSDLVARADRWQRRHRVVAVPLAVVYKFVDDQGGYLAAALTYYSLIAILPLMLIASSVLGFVLQGHPGLEHHILDSALSQFPIVGDQLGRPGGLRGSTSAVVVGALAAAYGAIGLGHAAQNAVNIVWQIPRNSRLNPVMSRLRSLIWLVLAGLLLVCVAVFTSLAGHVEILGTRLGGSLRALDLIATLVVNTGILALMMRLSTTQKESLREVLPGAAVIAVLWQLLQVAGGAYVSHVISHAEQMNGVFAVLLGLVALLYLAGVMALLGLEVNVVLSRHLYPRALLTPFTDAVELTEADRKVYRDFAQAQRHKGFERVHVTFDDPPDS
jgi:membrane protein